MHANSAAASLSTRLTDAGASSSTPSRTRASSDETSAFRILARQRLPGLEDRDARAEPTKGLGQLDPDRAGADDEEVGRQFLEARTSSRW